MEQTQRALQRAFCVAALAEGDDLGELGELLRTAWASLRGTKAWGLKVTKI